MSLANLTPPTTYRLPRESVAIYVEGLKQTSDVAKGVRYALGEAEAMDFYTPPINPKDAKGRRESGGLGVVEGVFQCSGLWRT